MPVTHKIRIAKGRYISMLIMTPGFLICYLMMQITQNPIVAIVSLLVAVCATIVILDKVFHFEYSYNMIANFFDDRVELIRGRRRDVIAYADIKEVSKKMIIDRSHEEQGYYNVRIKTKNRVYSFFSGENYELHLKFEKTDLCKLYLEFDDNGVKCC